MHGCTQGHPGKHAWALPALTPPHSGLLRGKWVPESSCRPAHAAHGTATTTSSGPECAGLGAPKKASMHLLHALHLVQLVGLLHLLCLVQLPHLVHMQHFCRQRCAAAWHVAQQV